MSDPFIIWTMRRTGGTTFSSLLTTLSEHPGAQHEPFNPDRKLGWITDHWTSHADADHLAQALDQTLSQKLLIKHCYELVPEALNIALIKAAKAHGYRHIVLDRQAEVDRVLSLELAKVTGAWGAEDAPAIYAEIKAGHRTLSPIKIDDAVGHMLSCADLRRWLAGQFDQAGETPLLVYFEEIYGDPGTGRATIETLLDMLGIHTDAHPEYEALLTSALTEKAQKSQSIAHAVPNIDALREALTVAHARGGFLFETATRTDTVPQTTPERDHGGIIIDVHADPGDDTAYYLAKGFDVICLESDPAALRALEARFGSAISRGKVLINETDLNARDSANPVLAQLIARYGKPYYIKIESVTRGERALIDGLTDVPAQDLPPYLSVQMNMDWEDNLDQLVSMGYAGFQLIRQGARHLPPQPRPAREGPFAQIDFTATMSGPFGRDLPENGWEEATKIHDIIRRVQAEKQALRTAGQDAGWHDLHARMAAP